MELSNELEKTATRPSLFNRVAQYKDSQQIRDLGLYPYFREISSDQDTEVTIHGKRVLMLGSNSYLGLSTDPRVKEASIAAVKKYGTGCAGSRFLNGSLDIHYELEFRLAEFVGKEAATLFSAGFMANQGLISSLVQRRDYVITDKLDHASIIDGALLCFGSSLRYEHNDMEALERVLSSIPIDSGKLIVVDGVFSMDGDIAKLPEIVKLAKKFNAAVMVDEAHSIGVIGPNGDGTGPHFGIQDDIQVIMGTFSKSMASVGGFIAGDKDLIEFLNHNSRALIFSASMPPGSVAAVLKALEIIQSEPDLRRALWANTARMKKGLIEMGFDIGDTETPIIPVLIGDMMNTFIMSSKLQERGIFVNPIVPPGVRPNKSLLRISLMATHTSDQIDRALNILGEVGRELSII